MKEVKWIRQRSGSSEQRKQVKDKALPKLTFFSSHKTPLSMDCVNAKTRFLNLETLDVFIILKNTTVLATATEMILL